MPNKKLKDMTPQPKGESVIKAKFIIPAIIAIMFLLPVVFPSPVVQNVLIMVVLYAYLGQGWNILGGYTGQSSYGHAVFYGVGAYTSSLLLINFGINPWIGMLVGAIAATILSALIGIPCFRVKGHFFLMATVGIAEIIRVIWISVPSITHGAQGVFLPRMESSYLNMMFRTNNGGYYYIILVLAILLYIGVAILERSKLGYYFKSIREDEEAAEALGVDVRKYKFIALAISAAVTAMGGTFYAQWVMYLDPYSTMPLMVSVQIALVAILGGTGTLWGPFVGAAVLLPVSEVTRIYLGAGNSQGLSMIVYGLIIILIAIWMPNGIVGWYNIRKQRKVEFYSSLEQAYNQGKMQVKAK